MTKLAFVDIETTGLVAQVHEPWEIAVIVREDLTGGVDPGVVEHEFVYRPKPERLDRADAESLMVGRFHERTLGWGGLQPAEALTVAAGRPLPRPQWQDPATVARVVAHVTEGAHLVAANPAFDAKFLDRFLRNHGQAPSWRYHLIDVEAMALGWLNGRGNPVRPPFSSSALAAACGVSAPSADQRHTALGDARWVRSWYDTLTGRAAA